MHPRKSKNKCPGCDQELPKDLPLSGWPSHPYGLHTDCPNCGKVIDQYINAKQKRES